MTQTELINLMSEQYDEVDMRTGNPPKAIHLPRDLYHLYWDYYEQECKKRDFGCALVITDDDGMPRIPFLGIPVVGRKISQIKLIER